MVVMLTVVLLFHSKRIDSHKNIVKYLIDPPCISFFFSFGVHVDERLDTEEHMNKHRHILSTLRNLSCRNLTIYESIVASSTSVSLGTHPQNRRKVVAQI